MILYVERTSFLFLGGTMSIIDTVDLDKAAAAATAKSLQSCPTLCDPIDGSPPGSPIPGILQARTLEWDAIAFSLDKARFSKICELLIENTMIMTVTK